jgi:hypothetical protein
VSAETFCERATTLYENCDVGYDESVWDSRHVLRDREPRRLRCAQENRALTVQGGWASLGGPGGLERLGKYEIMVHSAIHFKHSLQCEMQ